MKVRNGFVSNSSSSSFIVVSNEELDINNYPYNKLCENVEIYNDFELIKWFDEKSIKEVFKILLREVFYENDYDLYTDWNWDVVDDDVDMFSADWKKAYLVDKLECLKKTKQLLRKMIGNLNTKDCNFTFAEFDRNMLDTYKMKKNMKKHSLNNVYNWSD